MRLIDANGLLKELNFIAREQFSLSDEYGTFIHTLIKVEELICEQPIVEVVRCEDCKWYIDNTTVEESLNNCRWRTDENPDTDDFCSLGERIEV